MLKCKVDLAGTPTFTDGWTGEVRVLRYEEANGRFPVTPVTGEIDSITHPLVQSLLKILGVERAALTPHGCVVLGKSQHAIWELIIEKAEPIVAEYLSDLERRGYGRPLHDEQPVLGMGSEPTSQALSRAEKIPPTSSQVQAGEAYDDCSPLSSGVGFSCSV